MDKIMNMYALEGYKVKVTEETKDNGYDCDAQQVAKLLEVGKEYTVAYTSVHSSSSDVVLKEFPGETFNTVNFVGLTEQTEEEDKQHRYWHIYNGE